MEMTYSDYVMMLSNLGNLTKEQQDFFLRIESIVDNVFYYMKQENMSIEEAEIKVKDMTKATDNEMLLAITGVKEQLALFAVCEEQGHELEVTNLPVPRTVCKRCGFVDNETLKQYD